MRFYSIRNSEGISVSLRVCLLDFKDHWPNKAFAWWCYLTNKYQNAFRSNICYADLCHARAILHKRKNTEYNSVPQSILVVAVKWRHHANTFSASELCEKFVPAISFTCCKCVSTAAHYGSSSDAVCQFGRTLLFHFLDNCRLGRLHSNGGFDFCLCINHLVVDVAEEFFTLAV